MDQAFLKQKGSYRNLKVYKVSVVIYDLTFYFAHKYLSRGDRTIDQMVQAARSGKQNIAEGNQASITSTETELKLTNVAKASLEELLIDYEDYLRVRSLTIWDQHHTRYNAIREYASSNRLLMEYADIKFRLNDEELANLCITLIHQATYMLRKLILFQQKNFIEHGGVREQMLHARLKYRGEKKR